jgi:uroporphyrinogen III methyltransferase/synthase
MNLAGKRILITRARSQAQEFAGALLNEGAQPIFFPVIEIAPPEAYAALDRALQDLDRYNWLILKSVNGVEAVLDRMGALGIKDLPKRLRITAVGPVTAARLAQAGVICHFVPAKYTARNILRGLGDIHGKRFLLPGSDLSGRTLAEALQAAGGIVDSVIAYRTIPVRPGPAEIQALRAGLDVVCFASPSSVQSFVAALLEHELDVRRLPWNPSIACIGPVTAAAAKAAGLPVDVEAQEHTAAGLVAALKHAEPAVLAFY